jgi:DNA-binding transcriptional LysR family regulator
MSNHEDYLRNFDLNLLVVFMVLYRERSVSGAAKILRVGQPAVSNSLGKLRRYFNDPLFLRQGRGVVPTQKANAIATGLMPAVSIIAAVVIN